ncbi:MAG: hypothetical protein AAF531_16850 [Actinomycetota bacterium]
MVITLINRFCPLTSVIEDQIRAALVGTGTVETYKLTYTFEPPWSPGDMSDVARAELGENGFSFDSTVTCSSTRRAGSHR